MVKEKKQRVLAWPPRDFHWVEDFDDIERLAQIYAKLETMANVFSAYNNPSPDRPVLASEVYGFWFIFRDICDDLAEILKIDHWTGEIGAKKDGEGEES
jgi:hypothetical protein